MPVDPDELIQDDDEYGRGFFYKGEFNVPGEKEEEEEVDDGMSTSLKTAIVLLVIAFFIIALALFSGCGSPQPHIQKPLVVMECNGLGRGFLQFYEGYPVCDSIEIVIEFQHTDISERSCNEGVDFEWQVGGEGRFVFLPERQNRFSLCSEYYGAPMVFFIARTFEKKDYTAYTRIRTSVCFHKDGYWVLDGRSAWAYEGYDFDNYLKAGYLK